MFLDDILFFQLFFDAVLGIPSIFKKLSFLRVSTGVGWGLVRWMRSKWWENIFFHHLALTHLTHPKPTPVLTLKNEKFSNMDGIPKTASKNKWNSGISSRKIQIQFFSHPFELSTSYLLVFAHLSVLILDQSKSGSEYLSSNLWKHMTTSTISNVHGGN